MYSSLVCANWRMSPSKITFPSRRIRKLMGTSQYCPRGSARVWFVRLSNSCVANGEGILQAVRHQQGTRPVDIALFHDQFYDGVRSHRIKSAGRRIVKQQLRAA